MTHGLCGKEGAMVFKRVLKGIGRLMLTTAVMCGVGLFLCSSEVKATVTVTDASVVVTGTTFPLTVDVTNKNTGSDDSDDPSITGQKIVLYNGSTIIAEFEYTATINSNSKDTIILSDEDFINNVEQSQISSGSTVEFNKVAVTYKNNYDSSERTVDSNIFSGTSATIYEVKVTKDTATGVTFEPEFTYKVGNRNMPYGYAGEPYEVTVKPKNDTFDLNNYYSLVRKKSDNSDISTGDTGWGPASNNIIFTYTDNDNNKIQTTKEDNELKVAYLPKIKTLKVNDVTGDGKTNSAKDRIDVFVPDNSTDSTSTIKYEIGAFEEDNENLDKGTALSKYNVLSKVIPSQINWGMLGADIPNPAVGECIVKTKLNNINASGSGTIAISAELGVGQEKMADVSLNVFVGAKPKEMILQNVPISVMAGGSTTTVKIFNGINPSGANQDPSIYSGRILGETPTGQLDSASLAYNEATGEITVKASSGATPGKTVTVTLELHDGYNTITQDIPVKIISFDKGKTIDSINKSNKNYITYNKDKGYSLDIKQLIIDNAKDSSGNAITISKDQITVINVGGSSCDGSWKPSEAALNKKVTCKINGVAITESDDLKVSAYPMPTATYSSSNRTLSVKIPTKVATAYSDDNNIRQSKGFKLILEDSSGNTLYEYTDSKYQNVLSSSSESTVTYTVPAADIEGMITSAASNGKFSADTTSVKFKVIPMGYKQSSTSDETIKAKDEIAGKTDAVTVYKVSASGTNFTSSAAYGLDGQTVSITATPNSGYSFKQWSDGNTSNPRQVKVSASGTRSFQAVAGDRVANSTGAGGTDNSELYDDVPKTAESNSAIWLIVFMVFAVMGTTYALYLQLKAANSKHDR